MAPTVDPDQFARDLHAPPAPGQPYSVPLPNSAREGYSAVYRNFRFADKPLLATLDPAVRTAHEAFEASVKKRPNNRCLGSRAWDPATKTFHNYDWINYAQTAERRKNFGAGLVALHKKAGVKETRQYGVGLWCPNRPEWQIAGEFFICTYVQGERGKWIFVQGYIRGRERKEMRITANILVT
jgi:long-chain acyl-CoA synthetase